MPTEQDPALSSQQLCKAAVRKAARRLLPLLSIGYGLAYIDRVNISYAAVRMDASLGFSAAAYGLGAGLFSISYAICQVPANLMLLRFGARRWLSLIMLLWGIISMSTILIKTPAEFYILRLLLGAAEAGFFPGVIYFLSQWFPLERRSRAVSFFYISMPLSFVVMGPVSGWLVRLHGTWGLHGWQWLLLLEAVPAILLSAFYYAVLPDSPLAAKWLPMEECDALEQQLEIDNGAGKAAVSEEAILLAFREKRVWMLGLFMLCNFLCAYCFAFTAAPLLQHLTGRNLAYVANILGIIGLFAAASMVLNGWHSDRTHERYLHIVVPVVLMGIACAAIGLAHAPATVMVALGVLLCSFSALSPPLWTLPAQIIKGKAAAPAIAAVNTLGFIGGFLGPWFMGIIKTHTGTYQTAFLWLPIPVAFGIVLITLVDHYNKRAAAEPAPAPAK